LGEHTLMFKTLLSGYQGVVFDLDGTIIYSQHVWEEAIKKVVSPYLKTKPPFFSEMGLNLTDRLLDIRLNNDLLVNFDVEKVYYDINREFFKNFDDVIIVPGFEDFADRLRLDGKKLALATSNDREIGMEILEKLDLTKYFDEMFFRQDVSKGKPAPDIYNLAVKALGFTNDRVLVFEDSPAGVHAANLAKLKVVIVYDIYKEYFRPGEFGSNNVLFIKDYEEAVATMDEDLEDYIDYNT